MKYTQLKRHDLHALLTEIENWQYQGIPGVLKIESGQPGPTLGIMAMTHGNEPAGLAAFYALLQDDFLQTHLTCGSVYLILNNLAAARRYFTEAEDLSFTAHFRFVDQDMNRMPAIEAQELTQKTYEVQRVRQLLPIYQSLDYVLDLHSTSAPSEPMMIELHPSQSTLHCPGVRILIRGILEHLTGHALVSLCRKAQGYVIECGSHEDPSALMIAQNAVWRMLEFIKLLPEQPHEADPLHIYEIQKAIIFPDQSYSLTRILHSFEFLEAGTVLARGDGEDILVEQDAWVIMPPPRLKPVHPGSEFLYLASQSES